MEVWTSTGFILQTGLEISFLHLLSVEVLGPYAQKNRNWGKKNGAWEAILFCGVIECRGSCWLQQGQGFNLCHVSWSCHLLTNKMKVDVCLSALSQSFHSCLPFTEVFDTAYWQKQLWPKKKKKKSWSVIFLNNLWISKLFVNTDVQNVPVFQAVLGTKPSVKTCLTVPQQIWYWVIGTLLFAFSALRRFDFNLFV